LRKVPRTKADTCPYCKYKHDVNEGGSTMYPNGRCEIECAHCGKLYYYIDLSVAE